MGALTDKKEITTSVPGEGSPRESDLVKADDVENAAILRWVGFIKSGPPADEAVKNARRERRRS